MIFKSSHYLIPKFLQVYRQPFKDLPGNPIFLRQLGLEFCAPQEPLKALVTTLPQALIYIPLLVAAAFLLAMFHFYAAPFIALAIYFFLRQRNSKNIVPLATLPKFFNNGWRSGQLSELMLSGMKPSELFWGYAGASLVADIKNYEQTARILFYLTLPTPAIAKALDSGPESLPTAIAIALGCLFGGRALTFLRAIYFGLSLKYIIAAIGASPKTRAAQIFNQLIDLFAFSLAMLILSFYAGVWSWTIAEMFIDQQSSSAGIMATRIVVTTLVVGCVVLVICYARMLKSFEKTLMEIKAEIPRAFKRLRKLEG